MLSGYSGPSQNQPGALMYFPRNDENSESFFDGSEKSILLYIESDFSRIEQKFQPKKMFFLDSFTI